MKLTLMVSFLIALPYLFYQLWAFVAPGLYKHEKRLVYPLIASSIFLFYLGIAFVYYILLPMMFKIIPQFAPEVAVFSPDISQYLDFTIMMFMAFGFGFEMPIATILLISTGMTTAEELKKKRPYVIVGAFIVGMLLTPPDVISQIMLAIPMWLLFELGIIFSKFFDVRIKEASDARNEMDKHTSSTSTAAAGTATISADKLWEDDDYTYEEESDSSSNRTIHNEYQDDDAFESASPEEDSVNDMIDKESLDSDLYDEDYLPEDSDGTPMQDSEEETFFDNEDFDELSDEEMETELDRIEADEDADDIVEEKARQRAEDNKNKDSDDSS
jgi:sec-independent protein translocase protein TatC